MVLCENSSPPAFSGGTFEEIVLLCNYNPRILRRHTEVAGEPFDHPVRYLKITLIHDPY